MFYRFLVVQYFAVFDFKYFNHFMRFWSGSVPRGHGHPRLWTDIIRGQANINGRTSSAFVRLGGRSSSDPSSPSVVISSDPSTFVLEADGPPISLKRPSSESVLEAQGQGPSASVLGRPPSSMTVHIG